MDTGAVAEDFPLNTPELIARIEQFHLYFGQARAHAFAFLTENAFGADVRFFGQAVALRFRSPRLRSKNRVGNFTEADAPHLKEIRAYYAEAGLQPSVYVPYGRLTESLFCALARTGFWSGGSGTVPLCVARSFAASAPSGKVDVQPSPPSEKQLYLHLFQQAFGVENEDELTLQWAEDSMEFCFRYVARIQNEPVGMASLMVAGNIAYCATAGTLPAWRGHGVQRALLRHRIAHAKELGANIVIGGGGLFSTTHRNFERVGMRLVPLGTGWGLSQLLIAQAQ